MEKKAQGSQRVVALRLFLKGLAEPSGAGV